MTKYFTDNPVLLEYVLLEELSYGVWDSSILSETEDLTEGVVLKSGDIVIEFYCGTYYKYEVV